MSRRGFTLIEVMVGVAVSLLVIGLVMGTFLSQQRSMQSLDLSREASNAARDALFSIQETLGRAGYGIDPRYAFDLRNYNCPGYVPPTDPFCRDRSNAPDELVFVERNPAYYWAGNPSSAIQGCDPTAPCSGHAWQVTGFDTSHVTVNARAGDVFLLGQVVEMTCAKGLNPTMGTVTTTARASSAGALQIALTSASTTNPYQANIGASHDSCFDGAGVAPGGNAAAGVSMFLVDRYRYFVTTLNGAPWLMLDRGLDYNQNGVTAENTGSGTPDLADLIPVAHGAEDLQIAYLLRPSTTGLAPPDSNQNWVIGDSVGVAEEPDPTATAPTQYASDTDPSRFTLHPANVRGVRVRLTVRSLLADLTQGGSSWPGDQPGAIPEAATAQPFEDRNDFTAVTLGHLRRYDTSVVVATPNLNSKDPFIF